MTTDPCSPQTLTAADGAELIACAHGGHILGWTPAGGQPRLWLSPTAECGPGLAIRGGIPVIFPQFSGRGPLPKHGLARDRAWWVEKVDAEEVASDAVAGPGVAWRSTLTDDEQTRAIWPHRFRLTLTARAGGDRLEITLSVRNDNDPSDGSSDSSAGGSTGGTEWAFAAALHAYLRLGDPGTLIHGLGGLRAEDNAAPGQLTTLGTPGTSLLATQGRDIAVLGVGDDVEERTGAGAGAGADAGLGAGVLLDDPGLGPLKISAEGFPDRVVWNPGPGHRLADVPGGAERDFVCIEPAALKSIILKPGSSWNGRLILQSTTY